MFGNTKIISNLVSGNINETRVLFMDQFLWRHPFFEDALIYVLALAVIVVPVGIIILILANKDINNWNDGYHSCGGKWEYVQAVGHQYDSDYIYKCDRCGDIEEFDIYRSPVED